MVRSRAAVACIVLVASNLVASAGAAEDWSGLYLGGAMSAGRLKSSTSYLEQYESLWSERSFEVGEDRLTVRNVDDVITIGAHASDTGDIGPAAGLVFGGNLRFGRAVAGVEFNFDWADFTNVSTAHVEATATRTDTTLQSNNGGPFVPILSHEESHTEKADAEVSSDLDWKTGVVGRLGFLVTESSLVYGLVGYARAGFSDAPFDTRAGVTLGAGLEASLGSGWFLRTEYRRTEFETWEFSSSTTQVDASVWGTEQINHTSHLKFNASIDEVRGALIYKFKGF